MTEFNPENLSDTGVVRNKKYEADRTRSVHLMIIAVLTISALAVGPSAVSLGWNEVWMLPLLLAGTAACWVLHVRELFTVSQRLWFYAIMAWFLVLFDGAHTSSLFDISVVAALELALFSQADDRRILHITMAVYLLLVLYQIAQIMAGNSVQVDSHVVSQIVMHVAIVVIIYIVTLDIIRKREEDRAADEHIIRQLTEVRRRTEDFMSNVSHELRTPVNVVMGISTVLEERLNEEEDKEDAAHILSAGKRLSDQVDDILDYTELQTGRLKIEDSTYMISSVINDVITSLGVYSREDLPQLIIDVDASVPVKLIGDSRRIRKVIRHLAENALKFTRRGGVYIRVYQIPNSYGINLCFEVQDTGIGMSRETIEHIRDGIYQADTARNRRNDGFGLGLQIVYGLVHAMQGFVRVESAPGSGTRVHVSFPQKVEDASPCMRMEHPERLKIAFYQRSGKFEVPVLREYYLRMIRNVIGAFRLTLRQAQTLADLKEMLSEGEFTHLFVADEEYSEEPAFFDALCDHMHVVVVAKNTFPRPIERRITILRKPLYAFPLVEVLNAENEEEAKLAIYGEEEVRYDGARILVVDDEEMNLVVARGIFASYGMEVETAGSGAGAIEHVGSKDYDAIFMDHMMPGMDGVEAAHRIRALTEKEGRSVKIIALTANAVSGAREMFMREGFDGFVAKPIERQELTRVLKTVLGRKTG